MVLKEEYADVLKVFSPGYEVRHVDHPILDKLENPLFRKIITYTDQAVFILNHSTFRYEFVSENVINLFGIPSSEFMENGVPFSMIHPDDLHILQTIVYPRYDRTFRLIPLCERKDMKFSYSFRLKVADGNYIHVLQQSIPLSFESGKVLLGMLVVSDISAFKKDNHVAYRIAIVKESGENKVLSQGLADQNLFSKSEQNILSMTARGFSEKQIADALCLSVYTVKSHRKNMFRKASVKNSAALVRYGLANCML